MGRNFEVCRGFSNVQLPIKSTKTSAGYDFEAAADVYIPSVWNAALSMTHHVMGGNFDEAQKKEFNKPIKPVLVPTGIKAQMEDDEYLALHIRSSLATKKHLILANGVGIVDADYYSNPDNDGHIQFAFLNFGFFPVEIHKGDRIGQGIFHKYLEADNARVKGAERESGFGSTGE